MFPMASLVPSASLNPRRKVALRLGAFLLSGSLVAACGAASKGAHRASTTVPTADSGGAAMSGTGSATTTSPAGSATTGGATTGSASTTVAAHASSGSGGQAASPPSGSGSSGTGPAPAPPAAGTYVVDQSGTVTAGPYASSEPAQGTLVVDPVQPDGVQVSHRYISSKNPPANTSTQYRSNGPFILSTTEAGPQGNTTCTFTPAIPAPPWPTSTGESFASQGNCGNFSVAVQGRIAGSQSVTLKDGETFTVWVIDSTLTVSGQVTGSGTQVDWYSPALRLPLHEQVDMNGTYQGLAFKLHSVSDLESSHPS